MGGEEREEGGEGSEVLEDRMLVKLEEVLKGVEGKDREVLEDVITEAFSGDEEALESAEEELGKLGEEVKEWMGADLSLEKVVVVGRLLGVEVSEEALSFVEGKGEGKVKEGSVETVEGGGVVEWVEGLELGGVGAEVKEGEKKVVLSYGGERKEVVLVRAWGIEEVVKKFVLIEARKLQLGVKMKELLGEKGKEWEGVGITVVGQYSVEVVVGGKRERVSVLGGRGGNWKVVEYIITRKVGEMREGTADITLDPKIERDLGAEIHKNGVLKLRNGQMLVAKLSKRQYKREGGSIYYRSLKEHGYDAVWGSIASFDPDYMQIDGKFTEVQRSKITPLFHVFELGTRVFGMNGTEFSPVNNGVYEIRKGDQVLQIRKTGGSWELVEQSNVSKVQLTRQGQQWIDRQLGIANNTLSQEGFEGSGKKGGLVDMSRFLDPAKAVIIERYLTPDGPITLPDKRTATVKKISENGYKFALDITGRSGTERWYISEPRWFYDQFPRGMKFDDAFITLWKKDPRTGKPVEPSPLIVLLGSKLTEIPHDQPTASGLVNRA